jgi:hypothetical protein
MCSSLGHVYMCVLILTRICQWKNILYRSDFFKWLYDWFGWILIGMCYQWTLLYIYACTSRFLLQLSICLWTLFYICTYRSSCLFLQLPICLCIFFLRWICLFKIYMLLVAKKYVCAFNGKLDLTWQIQTMWHVYSLAYSIT